MRAPLPNGPARGIGFGKRGRAGTPPGNEDETVIQGRPHPRSPPRSGRRIRVRPLLAGIAGLGLASAAVLLLRPHPPAFAPPLADEAAILLARPTRLTVTRWAPDPAVLVLDFPTLAEQGRTLNRVAALIEKIGQPRGRVLTGEELARAIAAAGDTPETYYYGHDYDAADIARFFALADRDAVRLGPEEERLRGLARAAGWLEAGASGALLSLPAPGGPVDLHMRAVILHHELSHGEFFTRPAYAAWTRRFWQTLMSAAERERMRAWLASEGYDPGEEETMMNEAQAYLVWTMDPLFFAPSLVGMSEERAASLRAAFLAGRPASGRDEAVSPP